MDTNNQGLMSKRLAGFKEAGVDISIYLSNGIKLVGTVVDFDEDTLILSSETGPEGVSINRPLIATMTRRNERSSRQEGGQRGEASQTRTPR